MALVDYVEALGQKLPDSLRCVLLSGDWIPVSLPGRIARAAANPRIASLGGATEGSIWSVLFPIDARAGYTGSVPYGKPLLNQTMHVLDASLRPRPEWVVGDLFIGGVGVAQGYWDDFEKTKASFIEHPSTRERLYRTGDLARYLPDGNLEFLGRLDPQVKVNGFRIELSEIEIALEQHPLVARAVVLAREGAQGSRRLVAWLQASPGEALEISVIEAYLRERLPAYMLPARYCVSTDLPLTPNGKIDRAALEVAPMAADAAESPDAPPSSATELALAAIWKSLLERGTVSRKQDFFAAGGDSFLAILLLTQIEDALGVRLGADTLLRSPSLEPLARAIDEARTASSLPTGCCSSLGESGAKAPLYLVHPAGGSAWCFRELAQSLAGSRPVRAFSSPGLADPSPRLETIEEMADRYVAELSSEGADSEFCLGGWSLGGVVAYEMARRLSSRGRLRLPVLLLDAPAPVRHELLSDAAIYTWFARDVLRLSAGNEASKQLPPITTLEELHTLLRGQRGPSISALSPQQLQQMLDVFSTNLRALANYRAPASRIELAVLRAEEATTPELATHPYRDQPDLGWAMLTGAKTSVRSVPGDHYSMLSGLRASALAASIEDVLGRS